MAPKKVKIYIYIYIYSQRTHDKTYNKTCATSEDSIQPAYPRSLIRVFADHMCLVQPPSYPKRDKREPLLKTCRTGLIFIDSSGKISNNKANEPAHEKTYNKTCATCEDSIQPAYPRSLIRVFADRMCLVQPPSYPKRDKREPLPYWVDIQADMSLC